MNPQFLLSEIERIEYEPLDPVAFITSLMEGETKVFACLTDGRRIDVTKPVCVSNDDECFFLKVPNPCNHDMKVAYVEAAIAGLVHELLLNDKVLVPRYKVITLPLKHPMFEALSSSPGCLIEPLEAFKSFAELGDDFQANIKPRFDEDGNPIPKSAVRVWQENILYSNEFAALLVVMYFISNNDLHQENFGRATYRGFECLAALDFDMSPMQFLVEHNCLGVFHSSYFSKENKHHDQDGGRHTPDNLDLATFPELLDPELCAENWLTNWCHGFNRGLDASGNRVPFKKAVEKKFEELAGLDRIFFSKKFETIFTKKVLSNHPDLEMTFNSLVDHFEHFAERFQKIVAAHNAHSRISSNHPVTLSMSQTDLHSPFAGSSASFYGGNSPFFPAPTSSVPSNASVVSGDGRSPDLPDFPPPTQAYSANNNN